MTAGIEARARGQRGTALIAGLVFLVILVMLGLSASSAAIQQEIIARNIRDEKLAMQAAEAALNAAQTWLRNQTFRAAAGMKDGNPLIRNSLTKGAEFCDGSTTCEHADADWWNKNATALGSSDQLPEFSATEIAEQPAFVIELIRYEDGEGLMLDGTTAPTYTYAITARGVGISDRTVRILHSIYRIG